MIPCDRIVEALREVLAAGDADTAIAGRPYTLHELLEAAADYIHELEADLARRRASRSW